MKRVRQFAWVLVSLLGAGRAKGAEPLAVVQHRAESRGYRIREVRWDPVLHQRWAVLQSIAHPELPFLAELTDSGVNVPASVPSGKSARLFFNVTELAVRLGDRVVLWSAEQNVQMQMGAIAEGNAAVGDRIQLRVTGAGVNGDTGWRVSGIVRGPGSVEMER